MEEKPRSAISNGAFYGSITGIAVVVLSLILFLLDLYLNRAVSWIGYAVMVGGMIWGTLEYRKKYTNGFLTFGQAFSSVFWIGMIAGVIASVYLFIFAQFIHPAFVNELLEQAREKLVSSGGNLTDDQIDQTLSMQAKFMTPLVMTIIGIITYAVMSAILGLILAIFLKKEDPSLKNTL